MDADDTHEDVGGTSGLHVQIPPQLPPSVEQIEMATSREDDLDLTLPIGVKDTAASNKFSPHNDTVATMRSDDELQKVPTQNIVDPIEVPSADELYEETP